MNTPKNIWRNDWFNKNHIQGSVDFVELLQKDEQAGLLGINNFVKEPPAPMQRIDKKKEEYRENDQLKIRETGHHIIGKKNLRKIWYTTIILSSLGFSQELNVEKTLFELLVNVGKAVHKRYKLACVWSWILWNPGNIVLGPGTAKRSSDPGRSPIFVKNPTQLDEVEEILLKLMQNPENWLGKDHSKHCDLIHKSASIIKELNDKSAFLFGGRDVVDLFKFVDWKTNNPQQRKNDLIKHLRFDQRADFQRNVFGDYFPTLEKFLVTWARVAELDTLTGNWKTHPSSNGLECTKFCLLSELAETTTAAI